jgi:biopolymer transport protein ExbD
MARRDVDDPARSARPAFNMTPMIDVTFQLIVVFLCSLRFRTLDEKVEAHLAREGMDPVASPAPVVTKVSVRLRRPPGTEETVVTLLDSRLGSAASAGVWAALAERIGAFRERDGRARGEIDADPGVPHGEVVAALDAFLAAGLTDVAFRGTAPNRDGRFRRPAGR